MEEKNCLKWSKVFRGDIMLDVKSIVLLFLSTIIMISQTMIIFTPSNKHFVINIVNKDTHFYTICGMAEMTLGLNITPRPII